MAILKVEIVEAAGAVWSGKGRSVTATTRRGEIGILPRHEPVLAILDNGGKARVILENGNVEHFDVSGGFLSVDGDVVTIVADSAARLTDQ